MSSNKKILTGLGIGCAGLTLLLFGGCGVAVIGASSAPEVSESASPGDGSDSGSKDSEKKDQKDNGALTSGVYVVGEDVKPGTYRTDGPPEDSMAPMCYWARLAGTSGELDDIIANGNIEGSSVLTVESSDTALELTGDCEWSRSE